MHNLVFITVAVLTATGGCTRNVSIDPLEQDAAGAKTIEKRSYDVERILGVGDREKNIRDLIMIIHDLVGTDVTVREERGYFMVDAMPDEHVRLADLLYNLKKTRVPPRGAEYPLAR